MRSEYIDIDIFKKNIPLYINFPKTNKEKEKEKEKKKKINHINKGHQKEYQKHMKKQNKMSYRNSKCKLRYR